MATAPDWFDRKFDAPVSPYERDFAAWLDNQLQLLRRGRFDDADWENLIEELDDLGKSQRDEVASRLAIIIEHLLKLEHSADVEPRAGWCESLDAQRVRLARAFVGSPSLRGHAADEVGDIYANAARKASRGVRVAEAARIPATAPYTLDQLLDDDFIPGGRPVRG